MRVFVCVCTMRKSVFFLSPSLLLRLVIVISTRSMVILKFFRTSKKVIWNCCCCCCCWCCARWHIPFGDCINLVWIWNFWLAFWVGCKKHENWFSTLTSHGKQLMCARVRARKCMNERACLSVQTRQQMKCVLCMIVPFSSTDDHDGYHYI